MSVDLDRQLREYCRHLDEEQGALSFDDILERSGEQQAIPHVTPGRPDRQLSPRRKWTAVAAAALAILVIAIGVLLLNTGYDTPQPADQPTTTTVTGAMTDMATIQAGVDALFSGDAERAAALFELAGFRDDDWIRREATFQAAIGGRLDLDCADTRTPGIFCVMRYHNAFTEALGAVDPGDTDRVMVHEGQITEMDLPNHLFIQQGLETFLRDQGHPDPTCAFGNSLDCANFILDRLGEWAAWAETNLGLSSESNTIPPGAIHGWPGTTENAAGVYSWDGSSRRCAQKSCAFGFMHNGHGSGDVEILFQAPSGKAITGDGATAVTVAGHDGIHRRLDALREEWIVEIEGTRIAIELTAEPGTSQADLTEAHEIIDSLRTEPMVNDLGFRLVFTLTTNDWDSG